MLFYSHWMDLFGKLVSFAIFVALLIATSAVDVIKPAMERTPNPEFFGMLTVGIILIAYYLAFHRPIVDVLTTFLYVRQKFGISISWQEAKILRCLFCLNILTLKWHPMKQVQALPKEERMPSLVEAAAQLYPATKDVDGLTGVSQFQK